MNTVKEVADYFLYAASQDEDRISNLKLQKLLYYAQGFHLAIFNRPFFNDEIEAWTHGPVVPNAYQLFKIYGSNPIPGPDSVQKNKFSKEEIELLDDIYTHLGQYSGWALRNITHSEPPWANTPEGEVISKDTLLNYFKTRVK